MKRITLAGLAGSLLIAFGAVAAHAQDTSTPAEAPKAAPAPAVAPAAPAPTARAVRRANRLLARDVRRVLVRVRGLDSGNIVVVARGDAVFLGGSVPVASQIPLAVEAAKGVAGVTSVSEKLTIRAVGQ